MGRSRQSTPPAEPEFIDADHSESLGEIPAKLYAKVEESYDRLQAVHLERKVGDSWRSIKRRTKFPETGPSQSIEEICVHLISDAAEATEKLGMDARFRVVGTMRDPAKSNGWSRWYCPISAEVMEDGEVMVHDASDLSERDNLFIMRDVIDKQDSRHDQLFDKAMEMLDKQNEIADKMVTQAESYARGIAGIGTSLKQVVEAATGALEAAANLTREKEREHVAIALAKLDSEQEKQKIGVVMELLGKVAGPLSAQIIAAISGKPVPTAKPAKKKAVAGKIQQIVKEGAAEKVEVLTEGGEKVEAKPDADDAEADATEAAATEADADAEEKPEPNSYEKLVVWLSTIEDVGVELQEILGGDYFEKFLEAAESKDPAKVDAAIANFKTDFDKLAKDDPEKLVAKMSALSELLGEERAGAFAAMLPG